MGRWVIFSSVVISSIVISRSVPTPNPDTNLVLSSPACSTVRNQIISNLYSHSSFLIQKIGDKLKEKHTKENYDLIQQLMNLPAANYETNRPKKRVKVDEDDARSNEIILDLSWCDRDLIVDNLMKNHHCAIMYSSKVSRAVKVRIIFWCDYWLLTNKAT